MSTKPSVYQRYPQLTTLRGLVPDELTERTVGSWADAFEDVLARARRRITTAKLCDVFPAELESGAIRLENFLGHWGNMGVEAVAKVCLIVRWLRPRRVLEIGTYNGMTTLQIALNAPPECKTYTLDLAVGEQTKNPLSEFDAMVVQELRDRFGTATGSYFAPRDDLDIVQLWGDSAVFDYDAALDGPLDLVFIDGAHDYETKRIDSESALGRLAPGGVVIWDNYADVLNPEVTSYLFDLARRGVSLFHLRGTYLVVHRDPRPRA